MPANNNNTGCNRNCLWALNGIGHTILVLHHNATHSSASKLVANHEKLTMRVPMRVYACANLSMAQLLQVAVSRGLTLFPFAPCMQAQPCICMP